MDTLWLWGTYVSSGPDSLRGRTTIHCPDTTFPTSYIATNVASYRQSFTKRINDWLISGHKRGALSMLIHEWLILLTIAESISYVAVKCSGCWKQHLSGFRCALSFSQIHQRSSVKKIKRGRFKYGDIHGEGGNQNSNKSSDFLCLTHK